MTFREGFKEYRIILLLGLFTLLTASFFSIGYNNPDEHWQILEFAHAKVNPSLENDLPWEYKAQIRQAIQPVMAFCLEKCLLALGCFSPFLMTFILRLISGLLSFYAIHLLVFSSRSYFAQERSFRLVLILVNLLWFMPYIHVRFQGENWAAIFFAFALYGINRSQTSSSALRWFLLAGICSGLAFDFRYQMALAVMGLGAWLLFYRKVNGMQTLVLMAGFLSMVVLEVLLDRWFYGNWVFTPYNYFYQNQIAGVAASFGVSPVWYYLYLFIVAAIPPLSLALFAGILISLWYFRNSMHAWILLFFVLGHSFIGHKEMRFLLPVIPSFCLLLPFCLQTAPGEKLNLWFQQRRGFRFLGWFLVIQNSLLLLLCMVRPANEIDGLFNKIYAYGEKGEVKLFYMKSDPYHWGKLNYNFYKSPHVEVMPYDADSIAVYKNNPDVTILVVDPAFNTNVSAPYTLVESYKTIPSWLKYVNFGDWISRSYVWSLYEVK